MTGFENIIHYNMIKMMYRYRYKLYYRCPNYIVLITDKNIMTRDDLYAYNIFIFFAFLENR